MKCVSTLRLFAVLTILFVSAKLFAQSDSAVWTNTTKPPAGLPAHAFDSAAFTTSGLTADSLTLAKMGFAKSLKPKIATSPYSNAVYSMKEYGATDNNGVTVAASAGSWEGSTTLAGIPDRYIQFNVKVNSPLYITSIKASMVSSGGGAVTADFYYSTDGWATSNLLVLGTAQKLMKDTMQTFVHELPNTVLLTTGQTFSLRMLPFNNSKTATTGKLLGFEGITIYANPTPLSVKIGSINASLINSQSVINWSAGVETNVSNYSIEKSTNGNPFREIGTIAATNSKNYSYTDRTSSTGISYYRVKSIDKSGVYAYSSVVKVISQPKNGITIFPNPVTGLKVNIQLDGISAGSYTVNIYTVTGQKISSTPINVINASLAQALTLPSSLKAGTYQLELTNGSTRVTKTIAVQ